MQLLIVLDPGNREKCEQMVSERGTLYYGNGYSYRRTEAREIAIRIDREAQYSRALQVSFIEKGCRKQRQRWIVQGRLVILAGWGHPPPPDTYSEHGAPIGPIETEFGTISATLHGTRFVLGDDRWDREFDDFLARHVTETGATMVADFRGHDFGENGSSR